MVDSATTGTFTREVFGFMGPARGIIDMGEDSELQLPKTDGDCTVTPTEETFEVNHDETGTTPREVYSLGQRVEIRYPSTVSNLEAVCLAFANKNYTLSDTEDPDGSAALEARKSAVPTDNIIHQKTEMTLDIFPVVDSNIQTDGTVITRTTDQEYPSLEFPQCVLSNTGDAGITYRNNNSVYTLMFVAVLPATSDTYYRLFNTDLALA